LEKSKSLSFPGGENGGAEGPDELGIYGQWGDVKLKHAFQFQKESLVFSASAGNGETWLQTDALDEGEAALSHGVLDARGDIGGGRLRLARRLITLLGDP